VGLRPSPRPLERGGSILNVTFVHINGFAREKNVEDKLEDSSGEAGIMEFLVPLWFQTHA
jgi:hypothetical protein